MIYEIVLKDGKTLVCFGKNHDEILKMFIEDSIFIVQENSQFGKITYILRDNVSYIRFSKDFKNVVKPVI